jgi:hypothetical protein
LRCYAAAVAGLTAPWRYESVWRLEGGKCNCALPAKRTPTQRELYDDMLRSLKPGSEFFVFVNHDPGAYVPYVRWDGYQNEHLPRITEGKWTIRGSIGPDGNPYEKWRRRDDVPVTGQIALPAFQPTFSFSAPCRT